MAYLAITVLLCLSTALQGSWPFWLQVGGQPPNLLVAAVACIGLVRGAVDGCLAGLIAGVLLAGAGHLPLGGLLLGLMVVGAGAGFLRGSLFAERVSVAILIAAAGVVISEFLRMICTPPPEFLVWVRSTLASAVFTALAAPAVFWLSRLTRPKEGRVIQQGSVVRL